MKLSLCLLITIAMLAFTAASRPGEKIHFQDSSELEVDERPGQGRGHGQGNRNHRGRGRGHQKNLSEFEEALPGVYPIRGPPQQPVVLPNHPGRGLGLQKKEQTVPKQNNIIIFPAVQTPNNLPNGPQQAQLINQPVQQPLNNPYADNPFLANAQRPSSVIPTNKYNTQGSLGVTNQLPTSDKPVTTTASYENPRRTDLLYGSNLLEEERQAERQGKSEDTNEPVYLLSRL